MRYQYDKFWIGGLIGLAIPFVGYAIILMVLEQLSDVNSLSDFNFDFRSRTLGLLAIAINIIPIRFFTKKRANESIRGVVIISMIYAGAWLFQFGTKFL